VGFVQCGHFSDKGGGGLQMRMSALFDAKNFGFFEIYGVSARTRGEGLSQCGHFSDKEANFSHFCANVFYGRLVFFI